jgi:hypothetical protein
MRPDFAKVLVERERVNSTARYKDVRHRRKLQVKDIEEAPTKQGMRFPHRAFHGERKELSENLTPLKNFLNKSVGRPWNKVYSELNEHINVKNAVQAHIRQHLKHYVVLHTHRDPDGHVWCTRAGYYKSILLDGELYVNHKGILCRHKAKHKKFKLLPGQKLYTVYAEAAYRELSVGIATTLQERYVADIKILPEKEYRELPVTPKRKEIFTFVADSREAIDRVRQLPEVKSYTKMYINRTP